jgi:hypothetical protein
VAYHLVPISAFTASGLTPRLWVRRAMGACANLLDVSKQERRSGDDGF